MSMCLGTGQDWGHLGAGLKPHVDVETPYDGLGTVAMRLHCRTMSSNAMCRNSHDCPGLSAGIHFQLCACTPAGVISDQPVIWLMLLSKCCYHGISFLLHGESPNSGA